MVILSLKMGNSAALETLAKQAGYFHFNCPDMFECERNQHHQIFCGCIIDLDLDLDMDR